MIEYKILLNDLDQYKGWFILIKQGNKLKRVYMDKEYKLYKNLLEEFQNEKQNNK